MKNSIDYIIVGNGYAALFFAHRLISNHQSFLLFSDDRRSASEVSAGIINPVVLKKFTTFWKAQQQIDMLKKTLSEIAVYTGKNYWIDENVHRIFHDQNEKELWLKKSENEDLKTFLNTDFETIAGVKNPFSTGIVNQSARLDVAPFFNDFKNYLSEKGNLVHEKFDYSKLKNSAYKDITFRNIVFCEGMQVKENPFFSEVPVQQNKGHHLKVQLFKPLAKKITLKKKHFLFPLDDDLYYYGGTYDREQHHQDIDDSAVEQLVTGLSEFYSGDFSVKEIRFGFRPTVKDRRPILGNHNEHSNYFVFNGLGARGILNGCFFSSELFEHIENGKPLDEEVNLKRFMK